jgi:hypothetical protein
MIKPFLTAATIAMASSTPAFALPYDDTVTFSASAVCAELIGIEEASKATDAEWNNYLKCIEVMHYFNTKYN